MAENLTIIWTTLIILVIDLSLDLPTTYALIVSNDYEDVRDVI